MPITFQTLSSGFKLKQKLKLKQWIGSIAAKEKCKVGYISYQFCTDEELLEINIKHLNHNTYTDIITFDYTEERTINGDIFISTERIVENAKKFQVTFDEELHRVIIHGVLHLCGYKDKKAEDAELMRKKENQALASLKKLVTV